MKTVTTGVDKYTVSTTPNLTNLSKRQSFIIGAGTFTWNSGTFANVIVEVRNSATLKIESDTAQTKDARLAGATLLVKPAVGTGAPGTVNFISGQMFLQASPTIAGVTKSWPNSVIENNGNFNVSGSAQAIIGANNGVQATFNQLGSFSLNLANNNPDFDLFCVFNNGNPDTTAPVTVTKGDLYLRKSGAIWGPWQIAENQTVDFHGAQYTWNGTSFDGAGSVVVYNTTIVIPKGVVATVNNLEFTAYSTIEGRAEAATYDGARSALQIRKTMLWKSGTTDGKGVLDITPAATLTIRDNLPQTDRILKDWLLYNRGKIILGWAPDVPNPPNFVQKFSMNQNATIENKAGSDFVIVDTAGIAAAAGSTDWGLIVVEKGAKFRKLAQSGESRIQAGLREVTGTVNVPGGSAIQFIKLDGTLDKRRIDGDGPATLSGVSFRGPANLDDPFSVAAGGELAGGGVVAAATFTNSGMVLPGDRNGIGVLTFNSNLAHAAGAFVMDLDGGAGPIAGTDYDQIIIGEASNQLTLAGWLWITVQPTFNPPVGTVYGIIDNRSALDNSGAFNGMANNSTFGVGGWTFRINYDAKLHSADIYHNDVILTVVGVPATSSNAGSISGTVWIDEDKDGIKDTTEALAAGVPVGVLNIWSGHTVRTLTNSSGAYTVAKLADDYYTIQFDKGASAGYATHQFTTNNADSVAYPNTGWAGPYQIANGAALTNKHAGLLPNHAPVGTRDEYTTNRNQTLTVDAATGVLSNDTDADGDPFTAVLVDGPEHGTLTLNADGSFTYVPNASYRGSDSFTYQPTDLFGPGELVRVDLTVASIQPTANPDTGSMNEDGSVTLSVLSNDTDPDGDTLSVIAAFALYGNAVVNTNGTVTYTPYGDWNGTDTITYIVSDGYGQFALGTATVTVAPVNDAPTINTSAINVQQNTALDIDLYTLVSDVETADGDLVFAVSGAVNGTVLLLADGHTARFTPTTGYHGAASFSLSVTDAGDGSSAAITTTATISTPVNRPPTAGNLSVSYHVVEGQPLVVYPSVSDPDGHTLTRTVLTQPAHGTVEWNEAYDGFVYTNSDPTFIGNEVFTYQVSDGHGGFATGTVTITLTNQPPQGENVSMTAENSGPIEVIPYVFDPDNDELTVSSISPPSVGTVTTNGAYGVFYVPPAGFTGTVNFSYTISDGHGGTVTIYVTLNIIEGGGA